jgi:copper transport protein
MTTLFLPPIRHAAAAAFIVFFLFLAGAESVAAHAQLSNSTPLSGSALATMPEEISLEFTEPVVPTSISLVLERDDGRPIPTGGLVIEGGGHRVRAVIDQASAEQGAFQVRWSVRSAADGHDSAGVIAFTVGTGRAPLAVGSAGSERDPWWQIAARTIWLLTLAMIAAGIIASLLKWQRPRPVLILAAGVVSMVAPLIVIRIWDGVDLSNSSQRLQLIAGGLGLVAALLLLPAGPRTTDMATIAWLSATICLAASGHAAGLDRSTLATGVLSLHSVLALIWLGALGALILTVRPENAASRLSSYSRVAIWGVLILGIAGLVFAPFALTGNRMITGSLYGRTLLIKTAIVILVLAISATNRWVVRPIIEAGDTGAVRSARVTMGVELAALAGVVCLAAILSSTAPPADRVVTQVASPIRTIDQSARAGELNIALSGLIAGTVDDLIRINVTAIDGSTIGEVQRVIVATSYRDPATGQIQPGERFDADPVAGQSGSYQFSALHLSRQAEWSLNVTVRRAGKLDDIAAFAVDTSDWQPEQPRLSTREWTWPIIPPAAWALFALAVAIPVTGVVVIRRHGQVAPLSGAVLLIALAMITSGFAIQSWQRTAPRTSGHDLTTPADTDPVAARTTYQTLCLACHGQNGGGIDQTDPQHQHGSGTDLLDPKSRVLSDGDLFTLISKGVGDTDMPAYDIALSDAERWNLVGFLRNMQANPAVTPTP